MSNSVRFRSDSVYGLMVPRVSGLCWTTIAAHPGTSAARLRSSTPQRAACSVVVCDFDPSSPPSS